MGSRIVEPLLEEGFGVVAYNRSPEPIDALARKGAVKASSAADVCRRLKPPGMIWLMVSAGEPVDEVIEAMLPSLGNGDVLIDGGNSLYTDSIRRAGRLKENGISFLDAGTSGGLEGARNGACLTVG